MRKWAVIAALAGMCFPAGAQESQVLRRFRDPGLDPGAPLRGMETPYPRQGGRSYYPPPYALPGGPDGYDGAGRGDPPSPPPSPPNPSHGLGRAQPRYDCYGCGVAGDAEGRGPRRPPPPRAPHGVELNGEWYY